MANRNHYKKETIEDRIRKYTRPHPIVTSHLRNIQQSYQSANPTWARPGFPGILTSPSVPLMAPHRIAIPQQSIVVQPQPLMLQPQPLMLSPVGMNKSFGQNQAQPIPNNRKRRTDNNDQLNAKKKKDNSSVQLIESNKKYAKFASEILTFTKNNTQSDDLLKKKLELRSALLSVFRKQFPGASLHLVGSSCNGFAGAKSDADFCVMLTHNRSIDQRYEACNILRQLQRSLRLLSSMKNILLIRAKVPILKFTDTISGCECDVNINNSIGIRNTHLLRSYSKYDNRLIPLVVTIKHWAKSRNINDASSGTLSSYSLVLMIIHYLQSGCTPSVLISLQKEHPTHFNAHRSVDELPLYEPVESIYRSLSTNKKCVGELLCGFFDYYANVFQWDYHAVSVRLGRVIPKSLNSDWKNKFICVEEPFELTNTARAVYDYGNFIRIKDEFKKANTRLSKDPSMHNLLGR